MDLNLSNNSVRLTGTMAAAPTLSHESRGERFFLLPLEVRRLSGAADRLPVLLREGLLTARELREADRLCVSGELRSFNNRFGPGPRLVLSVFARSLDFCDGPDENLVQLRGTLCKRPNLRATPMGRDICDLMLAVNRRCARSDYRPGICGGRAAREAAFWEVGERLRLQGRFQSRDYIKLTDDGPVEKTAYEVSAAEIEFCGAEAQ